MVETKKNRQMADATIGNITKKGSHYFQNCIAWEVKLADGTQWYWLTYHVPTVKLVFH
jgi:hypothetical protein